MTKPNAPKSHPRYLSNLYRDMLSEGFIKGITSLAGLIAQGRGETFDYLIGEKTALFAKDAIEAACATLLLAKHPIISVNGNTAILVPKELVKLSQVLNCKLEVNLFHAYPKNRAKKIASHLKRFGATKILLARKATIPGIDSNRKFISRQGQARADVVLVPLEDGDRTEALISMGKKVITIDLNPLSRTAQKATITIVDNITRAMPQLVEKVKIFKNHPPARLKEIIKNYDNNSVLIKSLKFINRRLTSLSAS